MCLIRGGSTFLKISVQELHRQLQFMGDADCQKRYRLAWGLQLTDPDQYPYPHTPDGLGKDKNKIVQINPPLCGGGGVFVFFFPLRSLAVAQTCSAQHKPFFSILNVWVEISSPPLLPWGRGCGHCCLEETKLLGPVTRLGLLVVCLFFVCVNNL